MHFTFGSVSASPIALLLVVVAVTAAAVPLSGSDEQLATTMRSCKELCGSCGCLGFYCGDECLCECDVDGDDEHDASCIERMQDRCESEKLPFEVLIQGSTGNRLVRSLFADPGAPAADAGVCIVKDPAMRKKRSTFSIYKPNAAAAVVADEVDSTAQLTGQHRARRLTDNAETLREVQSFLSEIGAELETELMQREERNARPLNGHDKRDLRRHELQENERFAVHKRDADTGDAEPAGDNETPAEDGSDAPAEEAASDASANGGAVLGLALNPVITTTTTTTTTVIPILPALPVPLSKAQMKQRLTAAIEQLKSKLVTADGDQLTAMRARKEEVKARLLADMEANKQRMSDNAAAAKQQFVDAQERSAQKAAEFQAQVLNQLNPAPVVQTNGGDDGDAASSDGDAVVGAAGPGALPVALGALKPALHKLRNLLTPGGAAVAAAGAGLPRLLPVKANASERALKTRQYLNGLGVRAQAKQLQLRQKLLSQPGGLAAWARTLGSGNPNGDAEDGVTDVVDGETTEGAVEDDSQAIPPSAGGIVVQPESLVDE